MTAINQTGLGLETLTDSNQPPKSRLKNASHARTLVTTLLDANRVRAFKNSQIQGMFDGNPPFSPTKLREMGQANRTNVNWGEGRAIWRSGLTPYYDLFSGSKYFFDVMTAEGNDRDQIDWSEIIAEELDQTLKGDDEFDSNMQEMLGDFLGFGKGFLMWKDATSWRIQCVKQSKVFVADGSSQSLRKLPILMIRESETVDNLWAKIKDQKAATAMGWNIDATLYAIKNAMPKTRDSTTYDYDFIQEELREHDIYYGLRAATVQMAHFLVKEFDGRISHFIVSEVGINTKSTATQMPALPAEQDFLYRKIGRFKNFRECLAPFFLEVLDGSWNAATGLGKDVYAPVEAKNRLRCSAMDLAFIRSGISLQAKTANGNHKACLIQLGSLNIIPADYDVQQSTVMGDVTTPLTMDRSLDNLIRSNTGVYRQRMQREDGNPITAEQVKTDQANETMLGLSAVNRFYGSLDKLGRELYRRLSNPNLTDLTATTEEEKEALDFQNRCMARGVPKIALVNISWVRASRAIGNGSIFNRQMQLGQLGSLASRFPDSGQQRWLEDAVSSIAGHQAAERYCPRPPANQEPDDQEAVAMIENGMMKIGAPVLMTGTQNHTVHAKTHLLAASGAAQSLQQGGNPVDVVAYLEQLGPHTFLHLQKLAADPSKQAVFKALYGQWQKLTQMHDKLKAQVDQAQAQHAQEQQRLQAAQSGMSVDDQIALMEARHKMAIQGMKAQQQMQIRGQSHEQQLAINDLKTASEVRRETALNGNQPVPKIST